MKMGSWKVLKRNPAYCVNEYGEIYSFRRARKLRPKVNHDGYLRIQLWSRNQCEFVGIHRLVAETFLPNPDNKPVVNHIDGNKQNNLVSNLEWCTQQENIIHGHKNGLTHRSLNTCGKRVKQFTKNGEFIQEFPSVMEAERMLGIAHSNICSASSRNGTSGGFRWEVIHA